MDMQIKIFVNILIISLLISLCSSLQGHRKLTMLEDGQNAMHSGSKDGQGNSIAYVIRRLIEVESMLDYENPGPNTRHQPGRGKIPRPRF